MGGIRAWLLLWRRRRTPSSSWPLRGVLPWLRRRGCCCCRAHRCGDNRRPPVEEGIGEGVRNNQMPQIGGVSQRGVINTTRPQPRSHGLRSVTVTQWQVFHGLTRSVCQTHHVFFLRLHHNTLIISTLAESWHLTYFCLQFPPRFLSSQYSPPPPLLSAFPLCGKRFTGENSLHQRGIKTCLGQDYSGVYLNCEAFLFHNKNGRLASLCTSRSA